LEKHSSNSLEERFRRIAAGDGIQLDMNRNVNSQIGLRDGGDKKAFFAFHTFVVEDSRIEKNRVRAPNYKTAAHAFV